jgi:hypothetical protein
VTFFRIGPASINVNYVFPSITPHRSCVRIAYSENVKALLEAILADMANMGLNVPPSQYTILKTSIDVDAHLPSRIATAEGQEFGMSQKLFEVFDKVPNHKYVHVIVKPRFSGMDFIVAKIDLFICFHKNWDPRNFSRLTVSFSESMRSRIRSSQLRFWGPKTSASSKT